MTTTANPTPTTDDDDQTLTTWCAQVAAIAARRTDRP